MAARPDPRERPGHDRRKLVGASELAQLGYCERVVHLDHRFGKQRSGAELRAQDRGDEAHERFHQEAVEIVRASQTKGRCFIATMALGECSETRALRAWRDLYLRRSSGGRRLIGLYYRLSPGLCRLLQVRPVALAVLRVLLQRAGRVAAWLVGRRLRP